ncbi:MAG: hypothetical protein AB7V04_07730 [Desulfomonilaceae bacterium]
MSQLVKAYPYKDERGVLLYEKLLFEPKEYSWGIRQESGVHKRGLGNVRRVLYNLPKIVASKPDNPVLFVKSEEEADVLSRFGYLTTTCGLEYGWNSWVKSHAIHLPLSGHPVWVITSSGSQCSKLLEEVSATLGDICPEVKLFELPGNDVNNVMDFVKIYGRDATTILEKTARNAPLFTIEKAPKRGRGRPKKEEGQAVKKTKFQLLDEILEIVGWEFFFDQFGELWVSRENKGHYENILVATQRFKDLVRAEYKNVMGDGISKDTIDQVISAKRGTLDPNQDVRLIEHRIVYDSSNDSIVIDSGRNDWSVIRIFKDDWKLDQMERSPFRRDANCASYDVRVGEPVGDWDSLFEIIAAKDFNSRGLIKMWMALTMIPNISKPGLIINGPPGAGKSFSAETIRQIVDPNENPLQAFPKDIENLKLALFKSHIPNFDNLNRLDIDQSDCMCQAITGISFEKRKLHTDADTVIWKVKRQWMLTGVNIPGAMADFLSRSFIVELKQIEPESRKDVIELEDILKKIKPGIQARLFKCASDGLRNHADVRTSGLHRLADAHRYCLAMSESLELSHSEIDTLWALNSEAQAKETLDGDVVAQAIMDFTQNKGRWEGTAGELYEELTQFCDATSQPWRKLWPSTPATLSKRMKYIMGSLKMNGVCIEDTKLNGQRMKTLSYSGVQNKIDFLDRI